MVRCVNYRVLRVRAFASFSSLDCRQNVNVVHCVCGIFFALKIVGILLQYLVVILIAIML
jgi:hypothetical protein